MKVCGNIEIIYRWHHMPALYTVSIHFGRVCMVQLRAKCRQWSATLFPWQTLNTRSSQQWKIGHTAAYWLRGCHLEVVGPMQPLRQSSSPISYKWITQFYLRKVGENWNVSSLTSQASRLLTQPRKFLSQEIRWGVTFPEVGLLRHPTLLPRQWIFIHIPET